MLAFAWYEPVYYKVNDLCFPSETVKKCGHFVGITKNIEHIMTFKILTDDTRKGIARSNVQTTLDESMQNKQVDPLQLKDIFSGPEFESSVIYNHYNDHFCASLDGEGAFSCDFSGNSSDEKDLPNNTITDCPKYIKVNWSN